MINLIGFLYRQNYRITHQHQIPCFFLLFLATTILQRKQML